MTDLDELLRETLRAVADTTPEGPVAERRFRRPNLLSVAAAALLVVGVLGAVVAITRDDAAAPATSPPSVSAVPVESMLAPDLSLPGLEITASRPYDESYPAEFGMVLAPGGEPILVFVQPCGRPPTARTCRDRLGGTDTDGRLDWTLSPDVGAETALGMDLYLSMETCPTVAVSADQSLGAWGPDVEAFFENVSVDEGRVSVSLPSGWTDLGSGRGPDGHEIEFIADIDGVAAPFVLTAAYDTQLGGLSSVAYGMPRPTTVRGGVGYLMSGGTYGGGGWTFVGFEEAGTTTILGASGISDEQLLAFAEHLELRPVSELVATKVATTTTTPIAVDSLELPADACDVSLDIAPAAADG